MGDKNLLQGNLQYKYFKQIKLFKDALAILFMTKHIYFFMFTNVQNLHIGVELTINAIQLKSKNIQNHLFYIKPQDYCFL